VDYLTRKCAGAGDCDEDWLRNRDVMSAAGKTTFLQGPPTPGVLLLVRFSDGAGAANAALIFSENRMARKTFVFEHQ
jgi:hypothetical protein